MPMQYRLVCDDNEHQCGEVYDDASDLVVDSHSLVTGHDEDHGHLIQVREVSDWCAYAPAENVSA